MKLNLHQKNLKKKAENRDRKEDARVVQNLTGADLDFSEKDWGEPPILTPEEEELLRDFS